MLTIGITSILPVRKNWDNGTSRPLKKILSRSIPLFVYHKMRTRRRTQTARRAAAKIAPFPLVLVKTDVVY